MTDADLTTDEYASEQSSVYARITVHRFAAEIRRLREENECLRSENELLSLQNTSFGLRIVAQAELLARRAERTTEVTT